MCDGVASESRTLERALRVGKRRFGKIGKTIALDHNIDKPGIGSAVGRLMRSEMH